MLVFTTALTILPDPRPEAGMSRPISFSQMVVLGSTTVKRYLA